MAKTKKIPYTQQKLQSLFEYIEGDLWWRYDGSMKDLTEPAGGVRKSGYRQIFIDRTPYYAHRLIFKMLYNIEPEYLDHINQDKSDNRIDNLRPINPSQSLHNTGISKANKTGVKGVCWYKVFF